MNALLAYFFIGTIIIFITVIFLKLVDQAFKWPEPLPKPYQCAVCMRKYRDENTLSIHMKVHRQVCILSPKHSGNCQYADQDNPFYVDGSEQCLKRKDKR